MIIMLVLMIVILELAVPEVAKILLRIVVIPMFVRMMLALMVNALILQSPAMMELIVPLMDVTLKTVALIP